MAFPLAYQKRTPYTAQYYYPPEYFSGCDVKVYFQGIWVDEINQLSFTLQEKVAPIYGYASITFDALAQGTKLVTGWFDINFKEAGYLTKLLHSMTTEGRLEKPQSIQFGRTLSDVAGGEEFERWAASFEKAIWGSKSSLTGTSKNISGWMEKEDRTFDVKGFDILITYGNYEGALSARSKGEYARRYGSKYGTNSDLLPVPTTVNSINHVAIVGVSKMIDSSGAPVMERYNFIAKDINKPITRR